MNKIPTNYVLEKFYTYSGNPSYNKFTKTYNASCPVCREGKSWLKKKRLFLYPESDSFYCFNCVKAWNIYTWLYQVSGMTKEEIHQEAFSNDFCIWPRPKRPKSPPLDAEEQSLSVLAIERKDFSNSAGVLLFDNKYCRIC